MIFKLTLLLLAAGAVFLLACSGGGGREIEIIATDAGCTPTSIDAATKEKLTFKVVNQAKGDRELEGIEGTKVEEVLVPAGRTRKVGYTTPAESGTQKLKCYIPGGPTTVIEIKVSGSASGGAVSSEVDVSLKEWSVTPSKKEVDAGRIRFRASNDGTMIHELALVSVDSKGEKHEVAEVEEVKAGTKAEFVANVKAGRYELACLIAPGEAGSTVDHYQQGMHTEFTVR